MAGGATEQAQQGTYEVNPTRDAEFDALQLHPQMRELLRAHPPLTNDAGRGFCVSLLGRGGLRKNSHTQPVCKPEQAHAAPSPHEHPPEGGGCISSYSLAPSSSALA